MKEMILKKMILKEMILKEILILFPFSLSLSLSF